MSNGLKETDLYPLDGYGHEMAKPTFILLFTTVLNNLKFIVQFNKNNHLGETLQQNRKQSPPCNHKYIYKPFKGLKT